MDIGSLPTDNLYKFAALSGVIMFLASAYSLWIVLSKAWEKLNEIEIERAGLGIRTEEMTQLSMALSEGESSKDERDQAKKRIWDLRYEEVIHGAKIRHGRDYVKFVRSVQWMVIVIGASGLLLAYAGFKLWHSKVQVYLDDAAKAQVATCDGSAGGGR